MNVINNIKNRFNNDNEHNILHGENNSTVVKKDDDKWAIPKNIPKWDQEKIKNLTVEEKNKYELIKKAPKKSGRYVEMNYGFYRISFWDFFPFFMGSICSITKLIIAYGDAKRTINFNKKMMWDFKNNLLVSLVFALIFWPILITTLFIFFPYILCFLTSNDSSLVTYGWIDLTDTVKANGISGLGEGINLYINQAIKPLFEPGNIVITILFWLFISMANVQTFLFWFLFRFNRKTLYEIQKNYVKEEIARIKNSKEE